MIIKNLPSEIVFSQLGLEEHSLYLVNVKVNENNLEHQAFLFTGFKTGSYCEVYTNTYERPYKLTELHFLEVVKLLHKSERFL